MRAARRLNSSGHPDLVMYLLEMTTAEALELSGFLGDRMRIKKADGTPQIEVQVRNALHSAGLRSDPSLEDLYDI